MPTEKSIPATVAELTKWKLSLAVSFSAVTGYLVCDTSAGAGLQDLASAGGLQELTAGGGLLKVAAGVFLLSSGAAALNQLTERKSDALMARTAGRPLPSGRMNPVTAAVLALLFIASGALFLGFSGFLPLILGLANVFLYNVVYTGLKKVTSLAIIPGALVGAVPPLIGYTAAGGVMTDTIILLFALFMFLWQMPHFWLLLVRYGSEYEKAGIRTVYNSMSSDQISRLILFWITGSSLMLWVLTAIFMPFPVSAAILLLVLNIAFITAFGWVIREYDTETTPKPASILFNSFSLLVMLILIAAA